MRDGCSFSKGLQALATQVQTSAFYRFSSSEAMVKTSVCPFNHCVLAAEVLPAGYLIRVEAEANDMVLILAGTFIGTPRCKPLAAGHVERCQHMCSVAC